MELTDKREKLATAAAFFMKFHLKNAWQGWLAKHLAFLTPSGQSRISYRKPNRRFILGAVRFTRWQWKVR